MSEKKRNLRAEFKGHRVQGRDEKPMKSIIKEKLKRREKVEWREELEEK